MVQGRGARYVDNKFGNRSSVDSMITRLEWKSPKDRRRESRLNMSYKIENNKVAVNKTNRLIPPKRNTRNMNSALSFQIPTATNDYRKCSFSPVPSENGMRYHQKQSRHRHLKPSKLKSLNPKRTVPLLIVHSLNT